MTWMPSTAKSASTKYSPFSEPAPLAGNHARIQQRDRGRAVGEELQHRAHGVRDERGHSERSHARLHAVTRSHPGSTGERGDREQRTCSLRARSPSGASTSRMTQAAAATKTSAAAACTSAIVRTMLHVIHAPASELADHQLLDEPVERRAHHVEEQRRPQTPSSSTATASTREHDELAGIEVRE